jgi:predicted flap endonuclease-1-like 5' DNA nuclease
MRHISAALVASTVAIVLTGCGTAIGSGAQAPGTNIVTASSKVAPTQKSHLYSALDILGVGPAFAARLNAAGVRSAADLLEAGHTRNGRAQLAATTGISAKLIMRWVNHADLIRVLQTGPVYARMLEDAGVDTVAELAVRNPHHLRDALEFVREKGGKTMVERVPAVQTVTDWVRRANDLGRYVQF